MQAMWQGVIPSFILTLRGPLVVGAFGGVGTELGSLEPLLLTANADRKV